MGLYKTRTNNDIVGLKVKVSQRLIHLPDKQKLNVLDAFAGKGVIWNQVIKKSGKKITLTKLEKVPNQQPDQITCVNTFWMYQNDISHFDIIDLDAYGFPYNQLKVLFEKKYHGLVFFTFCEQGLGTLKTDLIVDSGRSLNMARRSRTLYNTKGLSVIYDFLGKYGVKEINIQSINSKKHYGYFIL